MSGVSGADRKPTKDIVDDWAHDAGIVDKDHHVHGHAGMASHAEAWSKRHEGHGPGTAGKTVATGVVEHTLPEILEHGAKFAAAGAAVIAGIALFYREMLVELSEAEDKSTDLQARANNDAVNVALARSLAFDSRFGEAEQKQRPTAKPDKLMETLNGKDAAIKPILQKRADEGFLAMKRAMDATAKVPTQERAAAVQKWLHDNGYGDRLRNDVAFGKGAEYCLWVHATKGVNTSAEIKKVQDRQIPEQPFRAAG